jgi:hypothetical protein
MKPNELKCTDLRIGNYVNIEGDVVKVKEIYEKSIHYANSEYESFATEDFIQPIELTEEILVKIGFEVRKGYFNYSKVFGDDGDYCDSIYIYYCPRLNHFKFTHNIVDKLDLQTMDLYNIKYIHQLQNSFFLLTGKELEVEL